MNANILTTEIDRFIARLDTSILDINSPHESRVPMRSDMSFGIDLGGNYFITETTKMFLENGTISGLEKRDNLNTQ